MDLTVEKRKELCGIMPFLVPRNVWTGEIVKDYDFSYIRGEHELPDGWFKLFLHMCADISNVLIEEFLAPRFNFTQIKEKYGEMRCYHTPIANCSVEGQEKVNDIIGTYEYASRFVCCECGERATLESEGYICPYCKKCADKKNYIFKKIKFKPKFTVEIYEDGKKYKKKFNCSYIFKKLYEEEK